MDYAQFHALEARVRQLEEVVARLQGLEPPKPKPVEPFVAEPWQPIDWTARASMPPLAMRELAEAVPKDMCGAAEARALSAVAVGRQPVVGKSDPSQRVLGQGRGWVEPRKLPHHGQSYADGVIDGIGGEGKDRR